MSEQNRTIREWFESMATYDNIDNDTIDKAIKNTSETNLIYETTSLNRAFQAAFIWADTPEGQGYWAYVYDIIVLNESVVKPLANEQSSQGKDARYWFEQLPEPIRGKAIKNIVPMDGEGVEYENSYDAITRAFNWSDTEEGPSYWRHIVSQLIAGVQNIQEPKVVTGAVDSNTEQYPKTINREPFHEMYGPKAQIINRDDEIRRLNLIIKALTN
jgi:hypothetical protein